MAMKSGSKKISRSFGYKMTNMYEKWLILFKFLYFLGDVRLDIISNEISKLVDSAFLDIIIYLAWIRSSRGEGLVWEG